MTTKTNQTIHTIHQKTINNTQLIFPRLGVNIDHVATLRQARGTLYPSVTLAAQTVIEAGADQITIHLREDRRHIQDLDLFEVRQLTREMQVPLNLEMGNSPDILEIAIKAHPDWICLVPEKREERTTEGGLQLMDGLSYERLYRLSSELKSHIDCKISLFIEADKLILEKAISLGPLIDAVEIHTGLFAINPVEIYVDQFLKAKKMLEKANIGCHAGHGLTIETTRKLLEKKLFEEYNIGHSIVAESVFKGLRGTVKEYVDLFKSYPLKSVDETHPTEAQNFFS